MHKIHDLCYYLLLCIGPWSMPLPTTASVVDSYPLLWWFANNLTSFNILNLSSVLFEIGYILRLCVKLCLLHFRLSCIAHIIFFYLQNLTMIFFSWGCLGLGLNRQWLGRDKTRLWWRWLWGMHCYGFSLWQKLEEMCVSLSLGFTKCQEY